MAKKILLVQLYSNGDCLYATAVARQIKADFPGCHLTWAVASFCKTIIDNNPYVDEIMEVSSVIKDKVSTYRPFKKDILRRKAEGEWDEVFFTNIIDDNQAYYDGSIRSAILKSYGQPITVPIQPSLRLYESEIDNARQFAEKHQLSSYKNVILFEFAPLSKQIPITKEIAIEIAENIVLVPGTAIILSSAIKIDHPTTAIIDGSALSFRETAALTHHCTMLLGCSSGITWISTSDAGKQLPMVQLINAKTKWVNAISRDFERFNFPTDQLIELIHFDKNEIIACAKESLADFKQAKLKYSKPLPLHFKTTRFIIYNLLCYLNFNAIAKHIEVNRKVYGNRLNFYGEVLAGLVMLPFRLIQNTIRKKILHK